MASKVFRQEILNILWKQFRYRTDKDYREAIDTQNNDERNRYISLKAWSWAGYLHLMIAAVAAIILMVADRALEGEVLSHQAAVASHDHHRARDTLSRKRALGRAQKLVDNGEQAGVAQGGCRVIPGLFRVPQAFFGTLFFGFRGLTLVFR